MSERTVHIGFMSHLSAAGAGLVLAGIRALNQSDPAQATESARWFGPPAVLVGLAAVGVALVASAIGWRCRPLLVLGASLVIVIATVSMMFSDAPGEFGTIAPLALALYAILTATLAVGHLRRRARRTPTD